MRKPSMKLTPEQMQVLYASSVLKAPLSTSIRGLVGDVTRKNTTNKLERLHEKGLVEKKPYGTQRLMYVLTLAGRSVLDAYLAEHPKPEISVKVGGTNAHKAKYVHKEKPYDPLMAQPRTTNIMAGTYTPPADGYVRNGGLKHIPSRGF